MLTVKIFQHFNHTHELLLVSFQNLLETIQEVLLAPTPSDRPENQSAHQHVKKYITPNWNIKNISFSCFTFRWSCKWMETDINRELSMMTQGNLKLQDSVQSNIKLVFTNTMSVLFVVLSCHHDLVVVWTVCQQLPSFPGITDWTAGRDSKHH